MKVLALLMALFITSSTAESYAQDTNHYAVIKEYIRQLASTEEVRAKAEKEMAGHTGAQALADAIRNSTRVILDLQTNVAAFKTMHLGDHFTNLLPQIISFYEKKIALHGEIVRIARTMLAGPSEGVDYSALAARMPEITASLEFIDKSLFEASPLFLALLIDQHADRENHLSHLVITRAQRKELIGQINSAFGKKLAQSNQNYTVSCASVLRTSLMKDFKCADEPW